MLRLMHNGLKRKSLNIFLLSLLSLNLSISTASVKSDAKILIDTSTITLSGLSAGGYMANQFHLSHPEMVSGIGIIAAGPFGCARNSIMTALSECVNKAPAEYPENISDISNQFVDVAEQIKSDKVWLLHGTSDTRIAANVADALHQQYTQLIQANNLVYINDKPFPHLFPTENKGGQCNTSESPFIGSCGYDAAGAILSHIKGPLKPKVIASETGQLLKIEQGALTDLSGTGMHQYGYVYVPESCTETDSTKACSVHVSFHGCNQSIDNVNDQYAKNTGINDWAASNKMVVLYPQVKKSALMPMNPQACWDWWGYTDNNYSNKEGIQIKAVKAMVLAVSDYLNKSVKLTKEK